MTDLDCADHGIPTDRRVVDKVAFRSDVTGDASHLGPSRALIDPNALDGIKRFPAIDPNRRRGVERDSHGRCWCRAARHPTPPAPTSHAPQPLQFPRAPVLSLPVHLHAQP